MTTVLIWNNKMYGSNSYPGHAAMSIDDLWTRLAQGESYVSWWPGEDKKFLTKYTPAPMLSVSADLQEEGYAPDHILQLDGLRVSEMQSKWKSIHGDSEKKYRFLRHNCSTVVAQVLKSGGNRGSAVARNNLVWTPLKVKRLCESMGASPVTWSSFLGTLMKSGYLTPSDVMVLKKLYRRDERHGQGSTQNSFYYSGGRRVSDKTFLQWKGYHAGSAEDGGTYFQSGEGSIFSSGHIRAVSEKNFVLTEEYEVGL